MVDALTSIGHAIAALFHILAWLVDHPTIGVPVGILTAGAWTLLTVGWRAAKMRSGWDMRRAGRRRITSFGRLWG